MEQQKISPSNMLTFSFNTLFNNFGFWIGLILMQFLILFLTVSVMGGMGVAFVMAPSFSMSAFWVIALLFFGLYIVSMLVAGTIQIGLDFYDTKTSLISRLWSSTFMEPLHLVIGTLLYGAMVSIGMMFFVIPGLYLAVKFWFFAQIIVDKKVGALEALQQSSRITHSSFLDVAIVAALVTLITMIPFIGITLALLCNCYAYRQFSPKTTINPTNNPYVVIKDTHESPL